jgi:hypothetical protein
MSKESKFEWRLVWSNYEDTPSLRAATKACETFPLFKDSESHLITHEEFQQLVTTGELRPASSSWGISEGKVGLISKTWYDQYTTTWEAINLCKSDFMHGWDACEKGYQLLRDWDTAIAEQKTRKSEQKTRKSDMKRIKRTLRIAFDTDKVTTYIEDDIRCNYDINGDVRLRYARKGPAILNITHTCTGAELYSIHRRICIYYEIPFIDSYVVIYPIR